MQQRTYEIDDLNIVRHIGAMMSCCHRDVETHSGIIVNSVKIHDGASHIRLLQMGTVTSGVVAHFY